MLKHLPECYRKHVCKLDCLSSLRVALQHLLCHVSSRRCC